MRRECVAAQLLRTVSKPALVVVVVTVAQSGGGSVEGIERACFSRVFFFFPPALF